MKMNKKIASLMAVILLLMSTSVMSFAITSTEITNKLIIQNDYSSTSVSLVDKVFTLYCIFDAEIIQGTEDADTGGFSDDGIDYSVNSDFVDFFQDLITKGTIVMPDDYDALDEDEQTSAFDYAAMQYINSFYNSAEGIDNMQDLVVSLKTYIEEKDLDANYTIDTTDTSTNVTMSGAIETVTSGDITQAGYYLILDDTTLSVDDLGIVGAGALVTIPGRVSGGALSGDVTISLKGSVPTIDKKVWHDDRSTVEGDVSPLVGTDGRWDVVADYQIGDVVEYRIKVTIPSDVTGYDEYSMTITDTLSDGIVLDEATLPTLYLDSELTDEVAGDAHKTTYIDSQNFTVTVDVLAALDNVPNVEEFYIYYTATVTEDAFIYSDYESNVVTLKYPNNPYDSESYGTDSAEVYTYTFELDILKTKGDATTPLAGAVFALYVQDGEGAEKVQLFLEQSTDSDLEVDTYYPTSATPSGTNEGVITTDESGKFNIIGLNDALTYYLKEIKAPEGYNVADEISFTLHTTYEVNASGVSVPIITVAGSDFTLNSDGSLSATVVNTSNSLLPSTGGIGTTIFLIVGAIMMITSIVLLIVLRKKDE
ncbi:MAG: isopeptide-forming domain-containing fimbrial protein [Lachnospiraceae bacterium]